MKYQTINYKRLKNLGEYNNESVEATVIVEEGEDPIVVGQALKQSVLDLLGIEENVQKLAERKSYLEDENARLESHAQSAQERWNKIKDFMEKLGFNLDQTDEVPF